MYKAFGELRSTPSSLGTDYKFTGQREEASLGLYFFVSRFFDPSLGRFTSPDTIVPTSTQGTQAWDRYAFVNNNPVRYNDPTGHSAECDLNPCDEEESESQPPPSCLPNDAQCLLEDIQSKYGIVVNNADGLWTPDQLVAIGLGMQKLMAAMGNEAFQGLFSGVVFSIGDCSAKRMCTTGNRDVIIDTRVGNDMAYIQRETVHELAHVWSAITGTRMSKAFMTATGGYYQSGVYVPGSTPPTTHASLGRGDDWAESVTAFLYPGYGTLDPTRASFVGGSLSNPFLYFFNYMGMGR